MSLQETPKNEIVVTCLPGLGPFLAKELTALRFPVISQSGKSVTTQGTLKDTYFLNIWLRTASHVMFRLKSFRAKNANQVYSEVKKVAWEEWIPQDGYFSVHSFVRNDTVTDTRFPNVRVKDAIADRFMELMGKRPDSGPATDRVVVYLHWYEENAAIYIDTSGHSLSKRGYRFIPGKAPLAESLAAAVVMATGWDFKVPFINPMCGSGTIAIEAALMAYNIPPGYFRTDYAFQYLVPFTISDWKELTQRVIRPGNVSKSIDIKLSDINRRAVSEAKQNADKAGISHLLEFESADFRKINLSERPGIIVLNPPYGDRLGEEEELSELYVSIGDFFKNKCINYRGFVFTGNPELGKKIGLRTSSRQIFFNAKIECRLLEYELFEGSKKDRS